MSLRRATLAALAVTLTLVAGIGACVAYLSEASEADAFLDRQQRQMARYVGDLPFASAAAVELPDLEPEDDYVVAVRDHDGRMVRSSHPAVVLPDADRTGFANFSDGGVAWRVFSLVLPERRVQVAQQMTVRREIAEAGAWSAAGPILVAIPLIWLVMAVVLRIVFRPLERTAQEVASRGQSDTLPIPLDAIPMEVRPFVVATNVLLAKLETAMARQKAFLADAAHELRTPLTALTLQLGNLRPRTVEQDVGERLDAFAAGVRRASDLVDRLLLLARTEALPHGRDPKEIDLDDLLTQVVAGLMPLALDRGIDLGLRRDGAIRVRGQREDLRHLVEILLDNALRHTPVGGIVDVALSCVGNRLALTVEDDGPGIPEAQLARVFDRFVRAAAPGIEGSGLGLTIARAIAERNGLMLTLTNRLDRSGLIARVEFGEQPIGEET